VDRDFEDDVAVVAALRAGDEDAFAWLVDRYDPTLRRVARSFVANAAAADEVVQDTWLAVIEGIDRFEQRSSLKTWLYRILMNKARRRGVQDKRTVAFSTLSVDSGDRGATFPADRFLPPDHPHWPGHWASVPLAWEALPPEQVEARETLERVRAAIDELPPAHKLVITLRDIDGCTSAEVCALLDVTAANQRVLLHRARAKVRARLEDYFAAVMS
jgi:RNA polymerase sigma-70 factor (ECF subfamily)